MYISVQAPSLAWDMERAQMRGSVSVTQFGAERRVNWSAPSWLVFLVQVRVRKEQVGRGSDQEGGVKRDGG